MYKQRTNETICLFFLLFGYKKLCYLGLCVCVLFLLVGACVNVFFLRTQKQFVWFFFRFSKSVFVCVRWVLVLDREEDTVAYFNIHIYIFI